MNDIATANDVALDEEYKHLHPHAFHLQLPSHHKTEGGIPYATIHAHRKARAIVKLANGLVLKEEFFVNHKQQPFSEDMEVEEEVLDEEDDDGDNDDVDEDHSPTSLYQLSNQAQRLHSQLSKLSELNYNGGISQIEICEMFIKILRLLCATAEIVDDFNVVEEGVSSIVIDDKQRQLKRKVIIHYDNVGYIVNGGETGQKKNEESQTVSLASTEEALSHPFALPPRARQSLLNVALELIGGKKNTLRGVSNSAIVLDDEEQRSKLIISHQALLRMLLRTAPYLDEHKLDTPPREANGIRSSILKKTVNVIRGCRRFFDQGYGNNDDTTARQLWSALRSDVQYHTHSNSAFRALILLYLFHPTKCSNEYYREVLPLWMDCWRNIDRCPEWDYLWMVMFSRARKFVSPTDDDDNIWSTLNANILTSCAYWLQVPVGGVSSDKLFPNAKVAGTRSFPARLKVFVGMNGRYEEGMDFVKIITKLLIFCCATTGGSGSEESGISSGTSSLLRFLSYVTPYYNPSNTGAWTFPLGAFLHYLAYELCSRVGVMAGWKVLQRDHTNVADRLVEEELYLKNAELKSTEIVALLDKILPLCQQALYSKNANVSHAGETALLYLSQIDPSRSTPPLLDFSLRALDISSVNLSHQAPAALSALSRLLQTSLRANPSIILSRLPDILRLSLAGIDGNDQNKTLRTLILYRNLVMWIPVGGNISFPAFLEESSSVCDGDGNDGTMQVGNELMNARYSIVETEEYKDAIDKLPKSSIFAQHQMGMVGVDEDEASLRQEAMMAMTDWSLMFLDRVYELMRAAGEQEKLGKGHGGTGSRHTAVDVAMRKNVSRIMKETLVYFFSGMDEATYEAALRSVVKFFDEETLPFAVKDASLLCQAVCSTRFVVDKSSADGGRRIDRSPGLDALVPVLTEDLKHKSSKCATYRLRCLAGAVRYAGSAVMKHCDAITWSISFALSKPDDRALFKTGCKLLRHALSSQCEEYPIAQGVHPLLKPANKIETSPIGKSSLLRGNKIWWHIPSGEQINFTVGLLSHFTLSRWKELGNSTDDKTNVNLQQWRQTLRVLRYTLRGCGGILLDEDPEVVLSQTSEVFCPKEMSTAKLILSSSNESRAVLHGLRKRLCFSISDMMCLIAKDTVDCESKAIGEEGESRQYKKNEVGSISSDSKILKEIVELSELLMVRRGAQYDSSSGKTIYRGQKEILTDHPLLLEAGFLQNALARCNDESHTGLNSSKYKDGEDGGKIVSRALLTNRIHLCNQDLTANASSQIPRRLRRQRGGPNAKAPPSLFSLNMTMQTLQEHLGDQSYDLKHTSLEVYEALIDGLCAISCHPNINVRGNALNVVDFVLSRFGWVVKANGRPSRLLAAITLNDDDQKGTHGIPSCSLLVDQVNSQGKRSRLAEVVKGVTKIVELPKVLKEFQWSESSRFELVKALCGTQKLLQLVPQEEVAKIVHYINSIFLSYRSKLCSVPRSTLEEQKTHEAVLSYLLGILQEGDTTATPEEDDSAFAMHWRDRLVAAWFILKFIDADDVMIGGAIMSQVWCTVQRLIEEEAGQPIQRVSLGLLGRLVSLALVDMSQAPGTTDDNVKHPDLSALHSMFSDKKFCTAFANALVSNHREDTSVGGGHSAQWSSGIEEIIRDSNFNIARRTLFPFNRVSQKSITFKLQHSKLFEAILLAIGHDNAKAASLMLLEQARELVASPPSEDQRNQQVTSAEIFGGMARALIQYSNTEDERNEIWETMLLPYLDEAVVKMPTNILGAYLDALRYAIHHFPPTFFFPLLKWSATKVQKSLWQLTQKAEESSGAASSAMDDRFALQGKWLLMFQTVLVELDYEDDLGAVTKPPFYSDILEKDRDKPEVDTSTEIELGESWKYLNDFLTPCLLNSIAHPYDKCRDHVASCLFRMCYCHRKFINTYTSSRDENGPRRDEDADPGIEIMTQLISIRDNDKFSFKEKNRALGTARKFVACCVHWGDAKHEYSDFIIPLLPLAFQSLEAIEGEVSPEDRGIESELIKGYRLALADVAKNCVASYGVSQDITRVLSVLNEMSSHDYWQIRQACAHYLRNFQGVHKFLFNEEQEEMAMSIAISLLADDRREVSSAATSTLTGILTMLPQSSLEELVEKYIKIANKSLKKKKRKIAVAEMSIEDAEMKATKEKDRATRQQKSVFVLCAVVMGRPYDVPSYIPEALAALSKHSFEQRASLSVREVVKMVCSEFKKTHTDNWEAHRQHFTQEQIEALEDVVSTPHYYA